MNYCVLNYISLSDLDNTIYKQISLNHYEIPFMQSNDFSY